MVGHSAKWTCGWLPSRLLLRLGCEGGRAELELLLRLWLWLRLRWLAEQLTWSRLWHAKDGPLLGGRPEGNRLRWLCHLAEGQAKRGWGGGAGGLGGVEEYGACLGIATSHLAAVEEAEVWVAGEGVCVCLGWLLGGWEANGRVDGIR